jgi:hypothetical protein
MARALVRLVHLNITKGDYLELMSNRALLAVALSPRTLPTNSRVYVGKYTIHEESGMYVLLVEVTYYYTRNLLDKNNNLSPLALVTRKKSN